MASGDAAVAQVSVDWNAIQQARAADILAYAAALQADVQRTVRKVIGKGWSEDSLSEIVSILTASNVTQQRLILEALDRLDASPY